MLTNKVISQPQPVKAKPPRQRDIESLRSSCKRYPGRLYSKRFLTSMAKADIKGIAIMSVFCSPRNPIIAPKDVIPSRTDFEPVSPLFKKHEIWLAQSPDLLCWGNHRRLMRPRPGLWDDIKVGASAVPFKIKQGWLVIYHGADKNNRYCLGAVPTDTNCLFRRTVFAGCA